MDYQESIRYLECLAPTLEHPNLRRIEAFLEANGSPQESLAALHVGGTNGKGSTVAILDSVLRAGELKVGRFIGPHLLRWNERFHIDGQPIQDDQFAWQASRLRDLSEEFARKNAEFGPLTWFEFLTAMAFFFFAERKVDVAVFEVGLGGRFDATNVIKRPLAVGITNVSLDHTRILGDTIEKIAVEKAGIIKPNTPVITAAVSPAFEVIRAKAIEQDAPLIDCAATQNLEGGGDHCYLQPFNEILAAASKNRLLGAYQRSNTLVALEMLRNAGFVANGSQPHGLSLGAIRHGLENVYWPGRFQVLESPRIILDGAHNAAGAQALRSSLDELFPGERIHFVFSCYANKEGTAILDSLLKPGDRLYVGEAKLQRAVFPKASLAKYAERLGVLAGVYDSIEQAFRQALRGRQGGEQVVITGSFATIKAVVMSLGWTKVEDGLLKNESK
jgi:dihydrofolate synthase / folylpolyglutamate synthase